MTATQAWAWAWAQANPACFTIIVVVAIWAAATIIRSAFSVLGGS